MELLSACITGDLQLVLELLNDIVVDWRDINGTTALMLAATFGHIDIIDVLYQTGANINAIDDVYKATPILHAARCAQWNAVKKLLDLGAHAQATDHEGHGILWFAVKANATNMVDQLIPARLDPNLHDYNGITLLQYAVAIGQIDMIYKLIELEVNIDTAGPDDMTALMMAARLGHGSIVRILVRAGANTHIVNDGGMTASEYADKYGHYQIVKYLSKH